MKNLRIHACAAVLLMSAACSDATAPSPDLQARAATPAAGGHKLLGTITCHVDVVAQTSRCGDPAPQGGASQTRVTLTGSHYTLVTNTQFNSGGLQYFFNEIRNDIGQDIGVDGVSSDSIFAYVTSITTTGGSGTVTPNNHDGTRTFTAPNQAYWAWEGPVSPGDNSLTKIWTFNRPGTVTSFTYTIGVLAAVTHPNGWIEVTGDRQIPHGNTRQHTAVVRDWTGAVDNSGYVSWGYADVSGSVWAGPWDDREGTVLGVRVGTAEVTASKGSATPYTYGVEVY